MCKCKSESTVSAETSWPSQVSQQYIQLLIQTMDHNDKFATRLFKKKKTNFVAYKHLI